MTSPLDLLTSTNSAQLSGLLGVDIVWLVFKWGVVVFMALYSIFAAVIIHQTTVMSKTLEDGANGLVRMLAWVHFLASLLLTLAVILIV